MSAGVPTIWLGVLDTWRRILREPRDFLKCDCSAEERLHQKP